MYIPDTFKYPYYIHHTWIKNESQYWNVCCLINLFSLNRFLCSFQQSIHLYLNHRFTINHLYTDVQVDVTFQVLQQRNSQGMVAKDARQRTEVINSFRWLSLCTLASLVWSIDETYNMIEYQISFIDPDIYCAPVQYD